jgi:hypothetical protein
MAVSIHIGRDIEEAESSEHYLRFEENLDIFLFENKDRLPSTAQLLIDLDPYGDREFNEHEISLLIDICKLLKQNFVEQEVHDFADALQNLCNKAIQENKRLFALGD